MSNEDVYTTYIPAEYVLGINNEVIVRKLASSNRIVSETVKHDNSKIKLVPQRKALVKCVLPQSVPIRLKRVSRERQLAVVRRYLQSYDL